ncbi:hypothetical protein [Croceibacterium ferulae]|uniref:hypothetical protein n=1 Tax=Croceibacterium ferulae TaxID=1854641 RepID=UPI001F4D4C5B|nr:hypothetical protein [Croceibacterium ferulae]
MADTFGNTTTPGTQPITDVTPITPAATTIPQTPELGASHTAEAKSRFTAALDEAKAGAAALGAEAKERASAYKSEASTRGESYKNDATVKATDLAYDGKAKASEALTSLSRLISDNAGTVDEKLGVKYGDYVRSASRGIESTADRLNEKSLEELGEDAKAFVRSSPATALSLAAAAGYMFARILRK